MDARSAISVEEYLHTSFSDLDREYRDGELVERALPDILHGQTQALIGAVFATLRKKFSLLVCSETRMKLRTGLYLIPDVAVFLPAPPPDALVPDTPPLISIEILSPDERLNKVREKLEEYRLWGVKCVWLVDPHARRMYIWTGELTYVEALKVSELDLRLTAEDIFA
jgi:Uma2 family endonuclease